MAIAADLARGGAALVARDLACGAPGSPAALSGISLEVRAGSWVALTGANGGGKSSLLLTLAGLWPPLAGTLEHGAGRIATVLQEPATQLSQRTVRDEIAFTALNLGDPPPAARAAAESWAARFGLSAELDRAPHALSAGEQQRVLLAAALAAQPALLLADEAAAHLDGGSRAAALEIVREQVARGLAVLWVSQEEGEIERADRVLEVTTSGALREIPREIGRPMSNGSDVTPEPGPVEGVAPATSTRIEIKLRSQVGSARVRSARGQTIAIGGAGLWAIMGNNGAGKTSLLEAIAGIVELPEVDVIWRETRDPGPILVAQYPDRQIFEERVRDEASYAAIRRGLLAAEVSRKLTEACARLGLSGAILERRCFSLSAGEKRLIALIGALIAPASAVLLDEPTCGLDPERRSRLASWLSGLARQVPIVFATQDRALAGQVGAIKVRLEPANPTAMTRFVHETPSDSQKTD